MKLLLLTSSILLLSSCMVNTEASNDDGLPYGVRTFETMHAVCYTLHSSAISCIPRTQE